MVDLYQPKPEAIGILTREPVGKTRGGADLEIVQNYDSAGGRLVQREKERMLALRRIGRTIDEDQPGALEAKQGVALRRDIKRLDWTEPIPASRQRHDVGKIGRAFADSIFELFGPAQPVGGVFDAGGSGGVTAERVSRASGSELEGGASRREKSGYLLEKPAALRRQDPGRNFIGRRCGSIGPRDEAVQLSFEIRIGGSVVRFSDNLSELLSPFRFASAVSARF